MRSITSDETTFFQGWNSLALSIFIMSSCYDLWQKSTTMRADQHEGYYEFRRTNDSQHRTENRQQPANRFNRLDL